MEIISRLKYFRTSPRKIRLVTNLIKGLDIVEARAQLQYLGKRAAVPLLKLLNSAVVNAKHNFNLAEEDLHIKNILVNAGPTLKRWRPRAMGRATPIMKRTSHITLVLEGKEAPKRKIEKPEKLAKPTVKKEIKKEEEIVLEKEEALPKTKKIVKPERIPPKRPYPTSSQAKKRFFSRQTFGNIRKMFRRKSI